MKEYQKKWVKENREKLRIYRREWMKKWRKKYPEKSREANRRYGFKHSKARDLRIKAVVMEMYGGKCNCCGENGLPFLSIDHIIPVKDGYRKRPTGARFYRILVKKEINKHIYQILCFNCNVAKGTKSKCPHQK